MSEDEQMQLAQHEREQRLLHEAEEQAKAKQYYGELVKRQEEQTKAYIKELQAENERLQAKYDTLLQDSYAITMDACKCGRGKRPGYELCKVCRIAELEKGIARRDEDCQKLQAIMDENAELEAENERLREKLVDIECQLSDALAAKAWEDAERYRWIKDRIEPWRIARLVSGYRNDGRPLDVAIDAAMKGE